MPGRSGSPDAQFRAVARGCESVGGTPGAALDALAGQLGEGEKGTFIVVQNMRPDQFFTAAQQDRLAALLAARRRAQETGGVMEPAEEVELESLVEAELEGAARRAAAMIDELRS